jgi:hypothetical protein
MSKSQPFDGKALLNAARVKINHKSVNGVGVYGRFHTSNDNVQLWKVNSTYLYVGKTSDFGERFHGQKYNTSSYGEWTRNSKLFSMIAFCVLSNLESQSMLYMTEQVFVCLL